MYPEKALDNLFI